MHNFPNMFFDIHTYCVYMNIYVLIHIMYILCFLPLILAQNRVETQKGAQLYELRGKVAEKKCLRSFRDGPKPQIEMNRSEIKLL